MQTIDANFKEIEVVKYVRNEPLLLRIFFNDGKNTNFIEKSTNLENVEEFTLHVMSDVKKAIKNSNSTKSSSFLDGVAVMFGEDEEKAEERLRNAFRRVREDARRMNTAGAAQNYLQKLAMFQKSRYNV